MRSQCCSKPQQHRKVILTCELGFLGAKATRKHTAFLDPPPTPDTTSGRLHCSEERWCYLRVTLRLSIHWRASFALSVIEGSPALRSSALPSTLGALGAFLAAVVQVPMMLLTRVLNLLRTPRTWVTCGKILHALPVLQ